MRPPLVALRSAEGRAMFLDLIHSNGLQAYFPLASHRVSQADTRLQCASTLTTVLNALSIDPGRVWKWPWRWYAESMVAVHPGGVVAAPPKGVEELALLARHHGAVVDTAVPGGLGAGLRDLQGTLGRGLTAHQLVVAVYDRAGMEGRGGAPHPHFSMVGGYHPGRDSVLMLDVHPPGAPMVWVPVDALHGAMVVGKEREWGGGWATIASPRGGAGAGGEGGEGTLS